MRKAITLLAVGATLGVAGDRFVLEMDKPAAKRFQWLRHEANDVVNPWLLEHHVAGSPGAEFGTLEHVGRKSGTVHLTPVHPTLRGGSALIPAPLGTGSQWAQNVLHAGTARLQLHDVIYDLDHPELIGVSESGFYPKPVAAPFDRLGLRYVRMRVVASAPGAFATPEDPVTAARAGAQEVEDSFDNPIEPPIVVRAKRKKEAVAA
jgi:hypothetical protein